MFRTGTLSIISSFSLHTQQWYMSYWLRSGLGRKSWKNLKTKPTRCTNFSNLFFGIKLYMFRTGTLSIINSFSLQTQQWYMSYCLRAGLGRKSWKNLKIKPTRCTNFSNLFLEENSTCFGLFLCPSSAVFHRTHSNGICHTGLLTACEQDQDGTAEKFL